MRVPDRLPGRRATRSATSTSWPRCAPRRQRGCRRSEALAEAVARYYFKLLAYKDEYEVARLYTDGEFAKQHRRRMFEGDYKLVFHLAPPLLAQARSA